MLHSLSSFRHTKVRKEKSMKITTIISFILVIIGALNWLLVGIFSFDLVAFIFGSMSVVTRIIYGLVGIASLWVMFYLLMYRPVDRVAE